VPSPGLDALRVVRREEGRGEFDQLENEETRFVSGRRESFSGHVWDAALHERGARAYIELSGSGQQGLVGIEYDLSCAGRRG
jgi:hypothetical protein